MLRRSELSARHMAQWDHYRERVLGLAMSTLNEKDLKVAKIAADCLRISQDGERRLFLFSADEHAPAGVEYGWQEEE